MINIKIKFFGDDVDNLINIDHIISVERARGDWDENSTGVRMKDKLYSSPETFEAIHDKIKKARIERNGRD